MKRHDRDAHLDTRIALDLLEHRLDAESTKRIEAHLARPCPACREQLRRIGDLVATLRADRGAEVPESLTLRALSVFEPSLEQPPHEHPLAGIVRLLFDSLDAPLPAAARRSVGEARRLRYALGDAELELEIDRDTRSTMTLRGRLGAVDAALWSIRAETPGESRATSPDAAGSFLIASLPAGPCQLHLEGPGGSFRIPDPSP